MSTISHSSAHSVECLSLYTLLTRSISSLSCSLSILFTSFHLYCLSCTHSPFFSLHPPPCLQRLYDFTCLHPCQLKHSHVVKFLFFKTCLLFLVVSLPFWRVVLSLDHICPVYVCANTASTNSRSAYRNMPSPLQLPKINDDRKKEKCWWDLQRVDR